MYGGCVINSIIHKLNTNTMAEVIRNRRQQTPPPRPSTAINAEIASKNDAFLNAYDPNEENVVFSTTPSRGVPDVFEVGKPVLCKWLPENVGNDLDWQESASGWKYGSARMILESRGVMYETPVDAVQMSAIITTYQDEGTVPEFYAKAEMQERKPINGTPRAPLKVLRLYSHVSCIPATYISYKSEGQRPVMPLEVVGW